MKTKSPIGWVGGKSYIASIIVSMFPSYRHYIEPLCGALHVFFAKGPGDLETVNDLNEDLINFWLVCRDNMDELMQKVKWTPYSRKVFDLWKHEPRHSDPVERAARWFYINSAAYSAVYHGGWSYRKSMTGHAKPSQRFRSRISRLERVRDRLANVQIECAPYEVMFEKYAAQEENFLYCDPPYVDTEQHYFHKFERSDHEQLAALCHDAKARILLSYGDHDFVKSAYKDWSMMEISVVRHSARVDIGEAKPRTTELLLSNYEIQPDLFTLEGKKNAKTNT